MITQMLVGGALSFILPVLQLMSFPLLPGHDVSGFLASVGSYAGIANRYVDFDTMALLIPVGFAFDLAMTSAQFAKFLYSLVPFKAT